MCLQTVIIISAIKSSCKCLYLECAQTLYFTSCLQLLENGGKNCPVLQQFFDTLENIIVLCKGPSKRLQHLLQHQFDFVECYRTVVE